MLTFLVPIMFYPALLSAIFSFNYYGWSAGDIFFTSIEVGVLSYLKHNLLSSPKINLFNSFFNEILLKMVRSDLFLLQNKNTFRLRRSYRPVIIYSYTHIFILTYLHINIYRDGSIA